MQSMKKFALLLSFVFVAGVAVADEAKKPEAAKPAEVKVAKAAPAAAKLAGKTHELAAEIVSVDAAKSTITIKAEPENKTVPVDAKITASLKDVKSGDKVTLTCWDNAKGEHQKVVKIAPAKQ